MSLGKLLDRFPAVRGLLLDCFLGLHSACYSYASRLAVRESSGQHPKHRITAYHSWFTKRIGGSEHVLDVGCGKGELAGAMARYARRVTAVDIDAAKIAGAERNPFKKDNVRFVQADATRWACEEPVDVIVLSNVLEHIDQRVSFLRQLVIATHWNSGPRFLIRVPLLSRDWISVFKKERGVSWKLDPTHEKEYYVSEFLEELASAGLECKSLALHFGELFCEAVPLCSMPQGHNCLELFDGRPHDER
ncbi:class I SAM-dependent methyltransferase [Oleidesulfovibrio alaskensis]|uniref:class I SAM-dependent methyltransferase n=1 Tax=Oleidesulfovibrio alaskensis TaxID=58180 RepID=UPI0004826D09|nr:class I SAM-dependent methyltransferase [Oleidesulfovibrio alaskensis]